MRPIKRQPKIFMMDLWATVPYYTAYLSKALLAEGANVTVGSITYYLDPACFTSRGITVDPGLLDVVGKFKLPKLPRRILKLPEAMLNLFALVVRFVFAPPDVLHVQYLPMLRWRVPLDFWFLEFCQRRGVKVVLTVHDLMPHDTGKKYKAIFHSLYQRVDRIICHSVHIRTRLNLEFEVAESKIDVIPHGPFFYDLPESAADKDLLEAFGIDPGKTWFLWQGIVFPYKGIDLLLEAWKAVETESSNAHLVIAGTGSPELLDQIRNQVAALDLKNVRLHFRFITTEELVALYRAADIVVYPYRAITTSGALATGLALGKTIVASNLQVFREVLKDGENARLVDVEHASSLASVLNELVRDVAQRERLAKQVLNLNFGDATWREIARQTLATYLK